MALEKIIVPNLGTCEALEVIELSIEVGLYVKKDDILMVLESDKASMEIPALQEGVITKLFVKNGEQLKTGDLIAEIDVQGEKKIPETKGSEENSLEKEITLPDLGTSEKLTIINIFLKEGESAKAEDDFMTLESDKASMDIPVGVSGVIQNILVSVGDEVSSGQKVAIVKTLSKDLSKSDNERRRAFSSEKNDSLQTVPPIDKDAFLKTEEKKENEQYSGLKKIYAGPAARKLARDLGLSLEDCLGTGKRGRILTEDVASYAKSLLEHRQKNSLSLPSRKLPDFSLFGSIKKVKLSRIKQKTAHHLMQNHLSIPPVTQFDKADISELEKFRQEKKQQVLEQGGKLTIILFVMKALVASMKKYPSFNSSLSECGTNLIQKSYFNIGVAVETPSGLVVPVIKDVDSKSLIEISKELVQLSQKARSGDLKPIDMQGSSMRSTATAPGPPLRWPTFPTG